MKQGEVVVKQIGNNAETNKIEKKVVVLTFSYGGNESTEVSKKNVKKHYKRFLSIPDQHRFKREQPAATKTRVMLKNANGMVSTKHTWAELVVRNRLERKNTKTMCRNSTKPQKSGNT